jgi:aminoglycoside 3-N-acetyltransferase
MITRIQLEQVFRELGLEAGDSVIVHSSYRSLGDVEGGPAAVVQALLNALGDSGNLMVPTFNYAVPLPEPYFDPAATQGRTGIITEEARRWPDALRSLHPTHSVSVIGPDARELTRDHLCGRAVGPGSPIDRLAGRGGKVLLLGVQHVANTTVHVGEEHAGVPKSPWAFGLPHIKVLMPDGKITTHQVDTSTSCSTAFGAAEYPLRKKGVIRDARLNSCKMQLMLGRDVIDCVGEIIRDKPDILMCANPGCVPCAGARKSLGECHSQKRRNML